MWRWCILTSLLSAEGFLAARYFVTESALEEAPFRYLTFIEKAKQYVKHLSIDGKHDKEEDCSRVFAKIKDSQVALDVRPEDIDITIEPETGSAGSVRAVVHFAVHAHATLTIRTAQWYPIWEWYWTDYCVDSIMTGDAGFTARIRIHLQDWVPSTQVIKQKKLQLAGSCWEADESSFRWWNPFTWFSHLVHVRFQRQAREAIEKKVKAQVKHLTAEFAAYAGHPPHMTASPGVEVSYRMRPRAFTSQILEVAVYADVFAAEKVFHPPARDRAENPMNARPKLTEEKRILLEELRLSDTFLQGLLWGMFTAQQNYGSKSKILDTTIHTRSKLSVPDLFFGDASCSRNEVGMAFHDAIFQQSCSYQDDNTRKTQLVDWQLENLAARARLVSYFSHGAPCFYLQTAKLNLSSTFVRRFELSYVRGVPSHEGEVTPDMQERVKKWMPHLNDWLRANPYCLPRKFHKYLPNSDVAVRGSPEGRGYVFFSSWCTCGSQGGSSGRCNNPERVCAESLMAKPLAFSVSEESAEYWGMWHYLEHADVFCVLLVCCLACLAWQCVSTYGDREGRESEWRVELWHDVLVLVLGLVMYWNSSCWQQRGPFEPLAVEEPYDHLGLTAMEVNSTTVIHQMKTWTAHGELIILLWACCMVVFPIFRCICGRLQWCRHISPSSWAVGRILLAFGACLLQFLVLVEAPMSSLIGSGHKSVCQITAGFFQSSLPSVSEMGWASLTGTFMSYIGCLLITFLLAIPVGIYAGAIAFALFHWNERDQKGTLDLLLCWVSLSEVCMAISASLPFTIVYQGLGGNCKDHASDQNECFVTFDGSLWHLPVLHLHRWWCCFLLTCAVRPAAFMAVTFGLLRTEAHQRPTAALGMVLALNILGSVVGTTWLRDYMKEAWSASIRTKQELWPDDFMWMLYVSTALSLAVGHFLVLESRLSFAGMDASFRSLEDAVVKGADHGLQNAARQWLSPWAVRGLWPCVEGLLSNLPETMAGGVQNCVGFALATEAVTTFLYHLAKVVMISMYGDQSNPMEPGLWQPVLLLSLVLGLLVVYTAHQAHLSSGSSSSLAWRGELLCVGLGHWFLCWARWQLQFTTPDVAVANLHKWLEDRGFTGLKFTFVDAAIRIHSRVNHWCLHLTSLSLVLLLLAIVCHWSCWRTSSRTWSILSGFCILFSALLPLLPNYSFAMASQGLTESKCGPEFDHAVNADIFTVLGLAVTTAGLGLRLCGLVCMMPIALVRCFWLMLFAPREIRNQDVMQDRAAMLSWTLRFIMCMLPLATVYPLLFFRQLSQDDDAKTILDAFWLIPSLFGLWYPRVGNYRNLIFYLLWLALYLGFLLWYVCKEAALFVNLSQLLRNLDFPLLWSEMQAELCVSCVVMTDCFELSLEILDVEEPERDRSSLSTPLL